MVIWLCFSGSIVRQNIIVAGENVGRCCSPHGRQEAECMEGTGDQV
jgi:hypothetical protein